MKQMPRPKTLFWSGEVSNTPRVPCDWATTKPDVSGKTRDGEVWQEQKNFAGRNATSAVQGANLQQKYSSTKDAYQKDFLHDVVK